MPRIRSIKPEFWQDQKLSRLPALTRLVYICLWSMADDEGRVEADSETVWHFGFPREDRGEVAKALRVLAESSRIVLYRGANGSECIAIPRWSVHQKIDKPSRSKIEAPPAFSADSSNPPRTLAEDSTTDRDLDQGSGIRDQGSISSPSVTPSPSAPVVKRKTDPLILDLKNRIGSGVRICGDQIRALRGAGWDDARIAQAISEFAEPGMAPWEWTKKARGVVPMNGSGFKTMADRSDEIVRSILGGGS
jgi:hypothetical protein